MIDLHPAIVHMMAGTNDIAGSTGAETIDTIEQGGRKPGLSSDGVHPAASGDAIIRPIAEAATARARHARR